ncbi:MAG: gluconate 2-dehydrogenase subunit 3 family protein [Acetobacteraceae bacterium]|nr:gluconate 2-dehydrogenase subunit 3 family protein [Acetobacteraceae bacterium]
MRTVDKRGKFSRRIVLQGAAAAPAVAAAIGVISADCAWAQAAKALRPRTMAILVQAARDIFPHDQLADRFYVAAVAPYDAKAAGDEALKLLLEAGALRLDADAIGRHGMGYLELNWEDDRVGLLRAIQHTLFFKKLRGDLVVSLYNQKEVWPKFGYEGSSAEYGGYLHRGFNDIDWLPGA